MDDDFIDEEEMKSEALPAVDQSSSTMFSQFLNQNQVFEINREQNLPVEDSPPVDKIVKKIDFKDTIIDG